MAEKKTTKEERYIEAVGRRKTAVARVRITKSSKQSVVVNEQPVETHFPTKELQHTTLSPFANTGAPETFTISAKVKGGGIAAQAEAVRHGIARALVTFDQELRKPLKAAGFLKRDPRIKERKKFGLKKARKAAQWSKR